MELYMQHGYCNFLYMIQQMSVPEIAYTTMVHLHFMLLCLKQQLKLLMFLQGTQTLHCFVVLYVTNHSLLSGFCQKLSSRCIITNTTCTQLYSLSTSSQSIMIICVQIFCGSGETTKYYFNHKSGIAVYTYIAM